MDVLADFGRRVKEHRLRLNLSQEELGAECELDRTYISGIERGLRNPSLKNIYKLANSLEIPVTELFENSGKS